MFSHDLWFIKVCIPKHRKRKHKTENKPLVVNNLNIEETSKGDHHRYLETDKSVGVVGPLNKEKVIKKYKLRVKRFGPQS